MAKIVARLYDSSQSSGKPANLRESESARRDALVQIKNQTAYRGISGQLAEIRSLLRRVLPTARQLTGGQRSVCLELPDAISVLLQEDFQLHRLDMPRGGKSKCITQSLRRRVTAFIHDAFGKHA